jgi:hypothetical protein
VFVAPGQHGLTPLGAAGACCAVSVLRGLSSLCGVLQNLFSSTMVKFRFFINFVCVDLICYSKEPETDIRTFFEHNAESNTSKCNLCSQLFKKNHKGTLQRHLHRFHPAESSMVTTAVAQKRAAETEIGGPVKKNWIQMDEKTLTDACVNLVAVHGQPFALIDLPAFQTIVKPIVRGLRSSVSITGASVRGLLEHKCNDLKTSIMEELKGRLLCLKMDCCSRLGRSILGVNVQFIKNARLVIRTLAMKEVYVRHTGHNIMGIVSSILNEFQIPMSKIYATTTDNGSNFVKCVKLMRAQNKVAGGEEQGTANFFA